MYTFPSPFSHRKVSVGSRRHMKDFATGLVIATVDHLPEVVRGVVRRGHSDGSVPCVFFAEMAVKISQGRKHPRTKERLIVVTRDHILVYAGDGTLKRKVKVADVTEVILGEDRRDSSDPTASDAANSSSAIRRVDDDDDNNGGSSVVTAVGVKVPEWFDVAFELQGGHRAAQEAATVFARVVSTLRDVAFGTTALPLIIKTFNGFSSSAAPSFDKLFRLKKKAISDANQEQMSAAPPLLPPIIEPVTEASRTALMSDHRRQLDEIVTDLLIELHRYAEEQFGERNRMYESVVSQHVSLMAKSRYAEDECTRLVPLQKTLSRKNIHRRGILRSKRDQAQDALLALHRESNQRLAEHSSALLKCRTDIATSETRTQEAEKQLRDFEHYHVKELRDRELEVDKARQHLAECERDLCAVSVLPSFDALQQEIGGLCVAIRQAQDTVGELEGKQRERREMQQSHADMQAENKQLETQLLSMMAEHRAEKAHLTAALVRCEALEASKARLQRDVAVVQAATAQSHRDAAGLAETIEELRAAVDTWESYRRVAQLEHVACSDLERESTIHDSIASSVNTLIATREKAALSVEHDLLNQLSVTRNSNGLPLHSP